MGDRLKNRFKGISTPNIDEDLKGINDIIKATREQNFSSPYIHSPEKIQLDNTLVDAPRKREAGSLLQGLVKGAVSPVLGAYEELGQSGDAFKQGKIGSGIADLLKGTLHTAMIPITSPLGAVFEGLKGSGQVGGEVAKGLEQTMNLPFDAIKQGSELVKQVIESTGLDISDSETSKKFNDLAIEVGGLIALGKGHREAKKYVESKVPELKQVKNTEAELDIKPVESKPIEGLTQEKLPNEILNPDPLYHGTGAKFDSFEMPKENIGIHLGTKEQAKFVADKRTEGRILEVENNIKNPLELSDWGWENPAIVAQKLVEKGIFNQTWFDNLASKYGWAKDNTNSKAVPSGKIKYDPYDVNIQKVDIATQFKELREEIKQKGYDGIKYKNENEGTGESFISLNEKTTKIKPENLNLNISPKRAVLFQENKIAIKEILDKEGILTPQQISRRLTALKEQGKIRDKVSIESIKQIADEIKAGQEKPKVQEFKATPNSLGIALPEEMNNTRAVSFDRRSGLTVKEVLEQNPEFKPYVKDLTDINDVTSQLNGLYWKKRHKEPLPELPKEKTPETSFEFGENLKELKSEVSGNPIYQSTFDFQNKKLNLKEDIGDGDAAVIITKDGKAYYSGTTHADIINSAKINPNDVIFSGFTKNMGEISGSAFDTFKKEGLPKDINNIQPPAETTSVKNEMTSIQNAVVNEKRVDRGLEPIPKPETLPTRTVMNEAKRKIDVGEVDPNKLAKEILDNPRGIVQEQEAILDANMRKLENDRIKLADEISKETDPTIKQKKIEEAEYLQELYDLNDLAANQLGTDTARALQIREMGRKNDYSVAPVLRTAKIANKGKEVPLEVKTKLEEYSQQITRGEIELQEARRQLKLAQAEKLLQQSIRQDAFKERTQKRQVKKQDLDAEYDDLIKQFAKSQQFNALIDPHQVNILIKSARNRFKKGITNAEQLVDQLYQDIRQFIPELTKDDVINAIVGSGKYKRMTEGDISLELRQLRKEISDSKILETRKTKLLNKEAELKQMLESGNFEKQPRRIVEDTPEIREIRDRVDVLKQHVDREIRQLELANRTPQEKFASNVIDITNVPRTLMSSFDLSAPFRQGVILMAAYPKLMMQEKGAFREMFNYFGSEKGIRELQRQIEDSPNSSLYIKSKLFLANERKNIGRLEGREEAFLSSSPERLPLLGAGIRASNRAYAGFLDKARMDVFDYHVEQFKKTGITFENNPKAYKDLAKLVNIMSGRGTLGGFEKSATALTTIIYSPRLIASRLQFLDPRNLYKLDPAVRKIWIRDSIKFYGMGISVLTMAKLAGADVDLNPNSSDFLKIRLGNTRLDIFGGFQQYATLISKIRMGTQNIEGKNKKINRLDTLTKFAFGKASPSAGLVRDFLKGRNMVGEPFDLTNASVNLLTPLFLQDMYDAISEDGMIGGIKGIPGVFGVGIQTYKPRKLKRK